MLDPIMTEQEERFFDLIRRIDRIYDEYARSRGITNTALLILDYICMHPDGCTQKMICEELFYSKQSVNQVISSLLSDGLVALSEMDGDRRSKMILLTEKGAEYAERVVGPTWDAYDDVMSSMTSEQREMFIGLFSSGVDSFERSMKRAIDNP